MEAKNNSKKTVMSVGGGVFAAGVFYFLFQHFMYVTTDNAQVEAPNLLLAPKVAGFVVKVNVKEGQTVKAGDILVEIDDRDYQNTLTQVRAELASLEAKKQDADRNFKRISGLFKGNAVSQQQFDQTSTVSSEIKSKYAALSAQVAQAELNLSNTKIVAPINGVIAKKAVEVGQLAGVGTPLLGFVGSDERWVSANFKETEIDGIQPGQIAYIEVDAIRSRRFQGKIESLSAATGATFSLIPPDNATGNFTKVVQRVPVRITLENLSENDRQILRAGLSAEVKVKKH